MALEDLTGTKYIDSLNAANPVASDDVAEGDDHIRGIKNVLKTTFPGLDGAVNATDTELNLIDGGTARGTDALASGDGILINDAGVMKMTDVDTVQTFMQTGITTDLSGDSSPQLGGDLDGQDNTVSKINLKDYGIVTNDIGAIGGGAQTIDLTDGNSVTATVDTSTTTFTFSNPTADDELCIFSLVLTNGGSQTTVWTNVDWEGGTAPTLTTSGTDILIFATVDGGTIWHGQSCSLDSKSP